MKIGVCLLGLISNINSIQQCFTEIAYCNTRTYLQASFKACSEFSEVKVYFWCEVGVSTNSVPTRHCSHHRHNLTGKRHLSETKTLRQRPHSLLMSRPSETHNEE